ncbi:MAG TPA: PAS domain S-box protein, partial [Chloroflexota bacterium]|nr:PAS domain S-box protein [Chloroflexota bacterium]
MAVMNHTHRGTARARGTDRPVVIWLLIGGLFLLAIVVDYLAPRPYVMTPLYAPSVLVAAWRQAPRQAAGTGIVANLLNIASALIQGTPAEIWFLYTSGLVFVSVLATLVSVQRERLREHVEALRVSEEHHRLIVSSVKDYAIFALDPRGIITSWNDGAERVKGYRAGEIIGCHFSRLYTAEDARAGRAEQNLLRAARDGRCEDEGWRVRKDGSRFWAASVLFPLREEGGDLLGFVKITRDLTETRQAEEERSRRYAAEHLARQVAEKARQQQAFLAEASMILESSLDYEATLGAVARLAIPSFAEWCVAYIAVDDGSSPRLTVAHADPAVEAQLRAFLDRFPLSTSSAPELDRLLRSEEAVFQSEVTDADIAAYVVDQDDFAAYLRRIGLRSAMFVPMTARLQVLGALIFVSGGAERRYTEEDLTLAKDLARRAALAVDNARLYRQAKDAVLARDIVLASVSHDLRQPLTIIQGCAAMATMHLSAMPRSGKASGLPDLERIDRAARRMGSMIQVMVDTSQLLMGRQPRMDYRSADLVRLIREAVEEGSVRSADNVRVRVETAVAELIGQWDCPRLTRALGNLIGNAIKYSSEGGDVVVRLWRDESPEGAWALVDVRDEGVGIPAE